MIDEPTFDFSRAMRGDQLTRLRSGNPTGEDIAALRRMLQLDTAIFAAVLGTTEKNLASWETGTSPDRPILALLSVIARHPSIILRHELPLAV